MALTLALLFAPGRLEARPGPAGVVVISEIHYHPLGGGGELEWIELWNRTHEPIDLSGWRFAEGIAWTFPPGTWLDGGETIVVAANAQEVARVYGIANVVGDWGESCGTKDASGCRLDDGGEEIELLESSGAVHARVRYSSRDRWPAAADGAGPSLELRASNLDPADPASWRASLARGGSPGRANAPDERQEAIVLSELGLSPAGEVWIEIASASPEPTDLSGWALSDTRAGSSKWHLGEGSVIASRGFLVVELGDLESEEAIAIDSLGRVFLSLASVDGRIVDAWNVELPREGESVARLRDLPNVRRIEAGATPTPGSANRSGAERDIVIHEIHYHDPSDDPRDDWIELYNRSDRAIDLAGFALDGGVRFAFPPGTTMAPRGYLVVARDAERVRERYGLETFAVVGPDPSSPRAARDFGALSNRGETILLRDARGRVADEVTWHDGGEWPEWADGGGSSLELLDPFAENDSASAWDASDGSQDAPVTDHEYVGRMHSRGEAELRFILLGRGIVLVDDLSVRRVDASGAIVGPELVSNGDFEAPLESPSNEPGGWLFEGTHIRSGRTTTGAISGGASLAIVASDRGDNLVNRVELTLPPLEDGADYSIAFRSRWVAGVATLVTQGWDNAFPREHRIALSERIGSPGRANGRRRDVGPAIDAFAQEPAIAGPRDAITVTVRARDREGVASVRIRYTTSRPLPDDDPRVEEIAMEGPDTFDRFRASIPPHAEGTTIVYAIEAESVDGRASRFPRDRGDWAHPLEAEPGSLALEERGWVIARVVSEEEAKGESSSGSPPRRKVRLWLDESTEARIDRRRLLSNDLAGGTLVADGAAVYPGAGFRFSGSPFAREAWAGSVRIRPPRDRLLDGVFERFNLEDHQGEGGLDARERISRHIFRHFQGTAPAPVGFSRLVDWGVNDRARGIREHIASPGRELLARWFPDDDGDLYEMDDRHVVNDSGRRVTSYDARLRAPPWPLHAERLGLDPSDPELYRWHFEPRGRSERSDLGSIIELARLFDPAVTPDPVFDERAPQWIDVESFLRVLAVRRNTDDWDTWGGRRGKNAYLYRSERDGRFHLIPWDMELTYENPLAFLPPSLESEPAGAFTEVRRLLERPVFRRRYLQLLAELIDGPLSSAFLEPYLDRLDARGMLGTEAGRPGGFIDERRRLLEELLRDARRPRLELAIDGATADPSTSKTVIHGRAALEIVTVLVRAPVAPSELEGAFATLGTGHPLEWEARLALAPGSHPIEAIGFDAAGDLIARIATHVTVEPRGELFLRGDADGSSRIDVSDAVAIIRVALGIIVRARHSCDDALDSNDDGRIDLADSLFLLRALFASGSPPPPPFPDPGHDPTPDELECDG